MRSPDRSSLRFPRWLNLATLLALLISVPSSVTADWLLLRDGTAIETEGSWQTEERVVVFRLAGRKQLSSLLLEEVDLEGSEELTLARARGVVRARPKPAPEPEHREPVMVITDKDVRRVQRPAPRAQPEPEEASAETDGETASEEGAETVPQEFASPVAPGLEVVSWHRVEDPEVDGVVIEGELRNQGRGVALGLELQVFLTSTDGETVSVASALLSATSLAPRQRSFFRAEFPDILDYEEVRFELGAGPISDFQIERIEIRPPVFVDLAADVVAG